MSSSNGYNWDADAVLKQLIEDRGKTKVVFMNGILTTSSSFETQVEQVKKALNLTNTPNSIDLIGVYNPTSSPNGAGD